MAHIAILLPLMILSTWNVHGAFSCIPEISDVIAFSDISFISEHWRPNNCLPILSSHFKQDVICIANPGTTTNNITRGGVAFIVRKSTEYSVREIKTTNNRILTIEIVFGSDKLFIIGSLLPSTNLPINEYKSVLCDVFDLCDICDELSESGPVILCGDFNTDIKNKPTSPKSKLLTNNMAERNLYSVFQTECNIVSFQTKDKKIKTVLDYIFVPEWLASEVKYKEIYKGFKYEISDHFPLFSEFNIKNIFSCLPPDLSRNIPKWSIADSNNLQAYKNTCDHLLSTFQADGEPDYDIDQHLINITATLLFASDFHIPYGKVRPFLKPYWKSNNLDHAHYDMRCARRLWKSEGSPRSKESDSFVKYKKAKCVFRKLHRLAVKTWHTSIFNEIEKATELDIGTFYRTAWKNSKRASSTLPKHLKYMDSTADNVIDMCNHWRKYYSDLAEEKHTPNKFDDSFKEHIDEYVNHLDSESRSFSQSTLVQDPLSTEEIRQHITAISKGKAAGPDFLTNEHIIYGGNKLVDHLCILFNHILQCTYVPEMFKVGKVISIYKGKNKDKCNPTNYRGITLTSAISKLFEKVILSRIENELTEKRILFPHPLQFGFRNDHGAIPACYVLKEAIGYYVSRGSPVFCAFLDNEKAFDRIWHNGLLFKLHTLGIDVEYGKS
ncbi:uncharacterized protein LOC125657478 [Ostrea edulis]|uniref:uncharacterized protein LOC125657478 n=1 Tax=Ostrea edulis TaxID=37623 RepID=UPI0024AFA886|nr:uncharacterized protein LOC125657478 [Ostrea edulis]